MKIKSIKEKLFTRKHQDVEIDTVTSTKTTTHTKAQEVALINTIQDEYVGKLEEIIRRKIETKDEYYEVNFGSKTGTGKSVMITKLLNNCPDLFFMITTLSRGSLNKQLQHTLEEKSTYQNFICYGSCDLTANTKKDANDIWNEVLSKNKPCKPIVWLRDEGHIKTNIFSAAFGKKVEVIVNISATNINSNDIECNFSDTLLLRHPKLFLSAHFEDALDKLLEVKEQHKRVKNYNPCMVVRCLDANISKDLKIAATARGLKCVDLNEDNVATLDICKDDNEYDVIINKMKIIEGVDIKRCHVIYIQNNIGKDATNIQLVGRSRRNALLWRDDIDILAPENADLLQQTLVSYIYYNNNKGLNQDDNGEFLSTCCNWISVEALRPNCTIEVHDGILNNGFHVYELDGWTGKFTIKVDPATGFNYIEDLPSLYETQEDAISFNFDGEIGDGQAHIEGTDIILNKADFMTSKFNFATGKMVKKFDGTQCKTLDPKIAKLILPITEVEFDSGIIKNKITKYHDYKFMTTNRLFAQLSGDTFSYSSLTGKYLYSSSVTTKIGEDSKLRRYIQNKYQSTLSQANTFTGTSCFDFDKKCNSCLGYMVEYYTKYQILGAGFLFPYLDKAIGEVCEIDGNFDFTAASDITKARVAIRACHLKYLEMMTACFGSGIAQLIQPVKVSDIIKDNYTTWIETIIELSNRTVEFITNHMKYDGCTNPVLHCAGVKGLTDFMSEDTILDLKATGNISKQHLMQVLSYYELSKTRSDLHINKVIVYDCISNKCVTVDNLDSKNNFD